ALELRHDTRVEKLGRLSGARIARRRLFHLARDAVTHRCLVANGPHDLRVRARHATLVPVEDRDADLEPGTEQEPSRPLALRVGDPSEAQRLPAAEPCPLACGLDR